MASTLEGVDQALAGLTTLIDAMGGPAMRQVVEQHTAIMWHDAQSHVRFGRGEYRKAIRIKVFDNGGGDYAGSVFVIQGPWARDPSKKWPKNLPIWLEHGTRLMDPRRHLLPAFNAAAPRFSRAVERLLMKSTAG